MTATVTETATETPVGYYVTVQDAGRTGCLLGPYVDHAEALANVRLGRDLACQVNDRGIWYAYGTSKITADDLPKGILNTLAGLPE